MSKKLIFILCLIIGAGTLSCLYFAPRKTSSAQTTIQFASWGSESEIKILKPILADFEKENPQIKVDFLHIPQNYFQKIHLLFASNTAPDVIFMNNHYLPVYVNAGVLEDLTPYEKTFDIDKFYKNSIAALSDNGKIYAIPRDISTLVIFYNKDLFDKYNVSYPETNWSYEDFLTKAKKLTHLPEVFGISFEEEPLFYLPYLTGNGVENFEDYTNKKMQNSLKNYADLRSKYHVAPRKEESASATMAQMFLQGKLAMQLSGRWLVPKYREEAKFNWDVAPFPKINSSGEIPLDASGWAISKSSKHKNEAIQLVKYLSSAKSSEKFTQSGLIVPARIDSANSPAFLDNKLPQNKHVFLSAAENSKPTPVTVNFREVLDNLKNRNEKLFNNN